MTRAFDQVLLRLAHPLAGLACGALTTVLVLLGGLGSSGWPSWRGGEGAADGRDAWEGTPGRRLQEEPGAATMRATAGTMLDETGPNFNSSWIDGDELFKGNELASLRAQIFLTALMYGGQAGRDKELSVWMIGDSTFRNQFLTFCYALGAPVEYGLKGERFAAQCFLQYPVPVRAAYLSHRFPGPAHIAKLALAFPGTRPDIIYFGAGLWLFRPSPLERGGDQWSIGPYMAWRAYETRMNDFIHIALDFATTVVVSTVHSQCPHPSVEVDALDRRALQTSASDCADALKKDWWPKMPLEDYKEVVDHCRDGRRGRKASVALNTRLRDLLARNRNSTNEDHPNLGGVLLHDSFALTDGRCSMNVEHDGVHFAKLLPQEVKLLLTVIEKVASSGGDEVEDTGPGPVR